MSRREAEVLLYRLLADDGSKQSYSSAAAEFIGHRTVSWQEHTQCNPKYEAETNMLTC